MAKNKTTLEKYDLRSVKSIFSGAAPLGAETLEDLQSQYPAWTVRQGYGKPRLTESHTGLCWLILHLGLTETSTVVSSTPFHDVFPGSSGLLLPSYQARIVSTDGTEITAYDQPGELVVKSPSVVLGYLNNPQANKETFQDGWMRTGDEAVVRKSPQGNEHIFIVDRIKELIKVKVRMRENMVGNQANSFTKGFQVAPAELEAHLLTHPAVGDAAVIPIPDDAAGELPKAYIVKSSSVGLEDNDRMLIREIKKHVEDHKARHKWLKGGKLTTFSDPIHPTGCA